MRLEELLNYFLAERKGNVGASSLRRYRAKLERFITYVAECGIHQGHEVTAEAVSGYSAKVKAVKKEVRDGARNHLWIVGTFLRWIESRGSLGFEIDTVLNLPKQERYKKRLLSTEQGEKLIQRATLNPEHKERDKLIIMLSQVEGLSPAVLTELTVLDTDVYECEIRLRKKKKFQKVTGKTAKYLMAYLKNRGKYLPKTDYLLVNKQGVGMGERAIRSVIRTSLKGLR